MSVCASSTGKLEGRRIMVTRPAHQADNFCKLLAEAGATALRCPAMRIAAPADRASLERLVEQLDSFDFLMFNSPNAAHHGIAFIHAHRDIPGHLTLGAIGAKTAQAVAAWGYTVDVTPPVNFDSETFLQQPSVANMQSKRVAILRGQDGRMLLGETLRQRGALVEFIETYRRLPPTPAEAEQIRQALHQNLDAIAVTSSETLTNLINCLDSQGLERLSETLLVVGHPRIAAAAHNQDLKLLVTAADPSDNAMFATLCDHLHNDSNSDQP